MYDTLVANSADQANCVVWDPRHAAKSATPRLRAATGANPRDTEECIRIALEHRTMAA